jgi:hypothetical protein
MSRRKNSKKKSTKRRRIGSAALSANSPIVAYAPIAAGYFLGDSINEQLAKVTGTLDPKIVAAAEAVAGFLIRSKVKGLAGKVAGGLLLGAGAKAGLKAFGVISGLPAVNGYKDMRTINGLPHSVKRYSAVNGAARSTGMNKNAVQIISGVGRTYSDQ